MKGGKYMKRWKRILLLVTFVSFSSKTIIVDQVKRTDILNQVYSISRFSTFQLN